MYEAKIAKHTDNSAPPLCANPYPLNSQNEPSRKSTEHSSPVSQASISRFHHGTLFPTMYRGRENESNVSGVSSAARAVSLLEWHCRGPRGRRARRRRRYQRRRARKASLRPRFATVRAILFVVTKKDGKRKKEREREKETIHPLVPRNCYVPISFAARVHRFPRNPFRTPFIDISTRTDIHTCADVKPGTYILKEHADVHAISVQTADL